MGAYSTHWPCLLCTRHTRCIHFGACCVYSPGVVPIEHGIVCATLPGCHNVSLLHCRALAGALVSDRVYPQELCLFCVYERCCCAVYTQARLVCIPCLCVSIHHDHAVYTRSVLVRPLLGCCVYTSPVSVYTTPVCEYTHLSCCVYSTRSVLVRPLLGWLVSLWCCGCVYTTCLLCIHIVDLRRQMCTFPQFVHISADLDHFIHIRRKMYTFKIECTHSKAIFRKCTQPKNHVHIE